MFIERSAGKIRFARTVFVLAGLLPCAAVAAWALHLRSPGHREAVREAWQAGLGVPVRVAAIEHVRPGVVRARDLELLVPESPRALTVPVLEVETGATEVRIRVERLECGVEGARLLAAVAGEWLGRAARFPRNCVIDIADFSWAGAVRDAESAAGAAPARLRVECVSQGGSRAIRAVLEGPTGGADEVRVVRLEGDGNGAGGERIEVTGAAAASLPVPILMAFARGTPVEGLDLGPEAVATGSLRAHCDRGRWSGAVDGRIERVDLAACVAPLQTRASGEATVVVRQLEWADGRLVGCELDCRAGRGRIEQRFLDGLVSTLGCRAGSAFRVLTGGRDRGFDAAGCLVRIDGRGVELLSAAALGGALAVADGLALVEPPVGIVPAERLAWFLAPPGAVYAPSAGPGAWLMGIMPRAAQAERPGGRGGF